MQGLPSLMMSSMYWKSIWGTQWNQCIRPWTCGLLHTSRPICSRRRLKNCSISDGQHRLVVAKKPAASSDAVAPRFNPVSSSSSTSISSLLAAAIAPTPWSNCRGYSRMSEPNPKILLSSSIGVPWSMTTSWPISKPTLLTMGKTVAPLFTGTITLVWGGGRTRRRHLRGALAPKPDATFRRQMFVNSTLPAEPWPRYSNLVLLPPQTVSRTVITWSLAPAGTSKRKKPPPPAKPKGLVFLSRVIDVAVTVSSHVSPLDHLPDAVNARNWAADQISW